MATLCRLSYRNGLSLTSRFRQISSTAVNCIAQPTLENVDRHIPTDADKRKLVRAKLFKSVGEVPETVSWTHMKRAKEVNRIRLNIFMMVATAIASFGVIQYGKYLHNQGDTLTKRSNEWVADLRKQGKEEAAAAAAAAAAQK